MSSLRELQMEFVEALLSNPANTTSTQRVYEQVGGRRRIEIYRNNTFTNLRNAMQAAYPVIGKLVGEGFFKYAATEYINRYPSSSGDLHTFGSAFADFLSSFSPAAELPYLSDVAHLEWACHTAFFAADHESLELERLASISEEQYNTLGFKLHPACRLLASPYPIDEIWHANQEGVDNSRVIDLKRGGACVLVRRPMHHAEVVSLTDSEWHFLSSIAAGNTLGTACENALQYAMGNFDLTKILQQHIKDMTLVDVVLR